MSLKKLETYTFLPLEVELSHTGQKIRSQTKLIKDINLHQAEFNFNPLQPIITTFTPLNL